MPPKSKPIRLRDAKGRFTTNEFKRTVLKTIAAKKGFNVSGDETAKGRAMIDKVIKDARISNRELNSEYKANIEMFTDLLEHGALQSTHKSSEQIVKAIDDYKGSYVIQREDGSKERVSKSEMKLELKKYKQLLNSQLDVPDFSQKLTLTYDGKMIVKIPNLKRLRKKIKEWDESEEDDFDSLLDDDTIYYKSGKKSAK